MANQLISENGKVFGVWEGIQVIFLAGGCGSLGEVVLLLVATETLYDDNLALFAQAAKGAGCCVNDVILLARRMVNTVTATAGSAPLQVA